MDSMINAYQYNFKASGNYASVGSYDDWIAVTYYDIFHFLDLENSFDRDIGAFTYLWQMIAGANNMSVLMDIIMIAGSYYLKSWPALAFFAVPLIPKIMFQIAFYFFPVLWQPMIPYHKLIQ